MKFIHRVFYVIVKLIGMSRFPTVRLQAFVDNLSGEFGEIQCSPGEVEFLNAKNSNNSAGQKCLFTWLALQSLILNSHSNVEFRYPKDNHCILSRIPSQSEFLEEMLATNKAPSAHLLAINSYKFQEMFVIVVGM